MGFATLETLFNLPGSQFPPVQIGTVSSALKYFVPIPNPIYSQAQGVVKDLEPELLRHLAQGTTALLITTKGNPQGELQGQVGRQCGHLGMGQS